MKLLILVEIPDTLVAPEWIPPDAVVTVIPDDATQDADVLRARLHDAANAMAGYLLTHEKRPVSRVVECSDGVCRISEPKATAPTT